MRRIKIYQRKINGITVWRNHKLKTKAHGKPKSKLLDTFDKIEPGEYVLMRLKRARLLRAMVVRRDYKIKQTKHKWKKGFYKMEKL